MFETENEKMTKYAIVTGASPSSIGFVAAKKLAASEQGGYTVILACRNAQKGQAAEALIRAEHPNAAVAVYLHLDLASFASIHQFVKEVHELDDGALLDPNRPDSSLCILINNAGLGFGRNDTLAPYHETTEGLEEIVGVNHFGTFLLTQLLEPSLKLASGGGRTVVVSSSLHQKQMMGEKKIPSDPTTSDENKEETQDNDDGDDESLLPNFPDGIFVSKENYNGGRMAYKISKLCNLWFTYELQRRLVFEAEKIVGGTSNVVRVTAISPGFIPSTGLTRRSGLFGSFFLNYVLDPFRYLGLGITRSPEDGAETIVQAACCGQHGGQYFTLPKGTNTCIVPTLSSKESMDATKAKQLWELSLQTCKLSPSSYL